MSDKEEKGGNMKRRLVSCFLALCLFCIFSVQSIFGYSIHPYASSYLWDDPQDIKWYYYQKGTYDYENCIYWACFSWEHETSKFDYSETTGGNYDMYIWSEYIGAGWHAYAIYNDKEIIIDDYWYPVFAANVTELISHEIGHLNGLLDVSNLNVLMRDSGYKGNAYPETDDINGINQVY